MQIRSGYLCTSSRHLPADSINWGSLSMKVPPDLQVPRGEDMGFAFRSEAPPHDGPKPRNVQLTHSKARVQALIYADSRQECLR